MKKIGKNLENFGKDLEKIWKKFGKNLENFGKDLEKIWKKLRKIWKILEKIWKEIGKKFGKKFGKIWKKIGKFWKNFGKKLEKILENFGKDLWSAVLEKRAVTRAGQQWDNWLDAGWREGPGVESRPFTLGRTPRKVALDPPFGPNEIEFGGLMPHTASRRPRIYSAHQTKVIALKLLQSFSTILEIWIFDSHLADCQHEVFATWIAAPFSSGG